ncbi:MAG TPA: hypothetical protein V6C58_23655, partial [Allocoleopsis sp.]
MNHNSTLVSFQQDGLELVINNATGEVFAGQNALAKMCNCESSDIRKYRGGSELVKSLPVKGLRGGTQIVKLYPEQLIKECLVKFNP